MSHFQLNEEAIFDFARQIESPDLQAQYLDQACGSDRELKDRVAELLRNTGGSFLERPPADLAQTVEHDRVVEKEGDSIGPFKLLQRIGEGGFGIVYMAEQVRPVRRRVALKVIKPGMDSEAVIARFEAERQALAMMDHPNIARVIDGGATEEGRPYFVMELVKGVPITEFCDKNELTTEERIELFITVCRAVQDAHQKGIIHRDLKPSNILVTLHDGKPFVKVIDFGVAKAINQQLTEKTLFTAFGQMIGTPQYMSPEQAEMSGLDVDTRSDVYSLGVILYELLTGSTPLEADRLRAAGYAEMQRLIREEEPPRPSNRISTSGDKLTVIAKHRSIPPDRLHRQVEGDLDWIVMKTLEKDRNRRYESPSLLTQDLENHLHSEPVNARPPTWGYRASKYVRRHRVFVTGAAIAFLFLLVGLLAAWHSGVKKEQLLRRLVEEKREWVYLVALSGDEGLTVDAIQSFRDSVPPRFVPKGWDEFVRGLRAFEAGDLVAAANHLKASHHLRPTIAAEAMLARTNANLGEYDEFVDTTSRLAASSPKSSDDYLFLARAIRWTSNFGDAKAYLDRHSQVFEDRPTSSILEQIIRLNVDANLAQRARDCDEASQLAKEFDTIRGFASGSVSLRAEAIAHHNWAYRLLVRNGRPSDAQEHYDAVLEIAPRVLASDQDVRGTLQLATFYEDVGDLSAATEYWQKANQIANSRRVDGNSGDFEYPFFLLRQKEYESAMSESQGESVFILSHVMAMLGKGGEDPKKYLGNRWDHDPVAIEQRLMIVAAWYLCGETQSAKSLARRFIDQENEDDLQFENQEVLDSVLKYYAGDDNPPQRFLALSKDAPDSELLAGVFVALRLVGAGESGDRADAERLAQMAFDNSGTYFTYTLSRTLLTLLNDEAWPRNAKGSLR